MGFWDRIRAARATYEGRVTPGWRLVIGETMLVLGFYLLLRYR